MRYICFIAVLLSLPLNASAQQRRSGERRSDQNQSGQNQSGQNQSAQNQSEQSQSDERRSDGRRSDNRRSDERHVETPKPPSASQLPWWERQQLPSWERKQMPAWEMNRIPGWENGNVARAMLDQQHAQQQYAEQLRHNQLPLPGNRHGSRNYLPSIVYVLPTYGYFTQSSTSSPVVGTTSSPSAPVAQEPPPRPMGALRLEVEPKESLQIYVDGVYVGTPADLGDELELAPGARRIELRANGHRSLTFSAEIVDGRLITYRGSLDRLESAPASTSPASSARPAAPAAPAAPAPVGSRVMYMIPGCYLGNVSPKNLALPARCDISKLTTFSQ